MQPLPSWMCPFLPGLLTLCAFRGGSLGIWITTPRRGVFFVNTNTLDPSLTFDPNSTREWPALQTECVSDQEMGQSE